MAAHPVCPVLAELFEVVAGSPDGRDEHQVFGIRRARMDLHGYDQKGTEERSRVDRNLTSATA